MEQVKINVSSTVFTIITGSELYQRPERYDDNPATVRASHALREAPTRRCGKGTTHVVTLDRAAARVIRDYCLDVGEGFAGQSDAETRADGRALLTCARQISGVLTAPAGRKA